MKSRILPDRSNSWGAHFDRFSGGGQKSIWQAFSVSRPDKSEEKYLFQS
jgi:hypothetical protein